MGWVCQLDVYGVGHVKERMGLREPPLKLEGEKGGQHKLSAFLWY